MYSLCIGLCLYNVKATKYLHGFCRDFKRHQTMHDLIYLCVMNDQPRQTDTHTMYKEN